MELQWTYKVLKSVVDIPHEEEKEECSDIFSGM